MFDTSQRLGSQGWKFNMTACMLEIYNEEYKDLLGARSKKGGDDKKHQVIHNADGSTTVSDLTTVDVSTPEKVGRTSPACQEGLAGVMPGWTMDKGWEQQQPNTGAEQLLTITSGCSPCFPCLGTPSYLPPFISSGGLAAGQSHGAAHSGLHTAQRAVFALSHGVHAQD